MTDMFDTLSIKCRFRWPSFNDLSMLANSPMPADTQEPGNPTVFGGLFGFMGPNAFGLICLYEFGTDGSISSVTFYSGSSTIFYYTLPSLPVWGSDDEVELRFVPGKLSLLYHDEDIFLSPDSDTEGSIEGVLENDFTLGVYIDEGVPYYHPGLISSAEITWLSSAVEGMSCTTNYYAAENITDSVWRNTADGVVVGALLYLPIRAVFYDSSTGEFVKLYPDQITEVVPTYTPIGVEVIPAEHDVYGTGQAGIMSLACMNYSTPDTGSNGNQYMYWGGNGTDTSLPNYNMVNYIGDFGNLNDGVVQGVSSAADLPSDQFTTVAGLDGHSNYDSNNYDKYAPSPYNADGSRNEAYYTTAYSTANALSDFDGVGNTAVLTELATSQSDWKTATTITNSYRAGYYPAACCCWRFHTAGTEQGEWYLPACGEVGYVINRISAINTTINKVLSVYSSVVAVSLSYYFWSSTEYSADAARRLSSGLGEVAGGYKDYTSSTQARAFLRL